MQCLLPTACSVRTTERGTVQNVGHYGLWRQVWSIVTPYTSSDDNLIDPGTIRSRYGIFSRSGHPQQPNICPNNLVRRRAIEIPHMHCGRAIDLIFIPLCKNLPRWSCGCKKLNWCCIMQVACCLHVRNSTNKQFRNIKFPYPSTPLVSKWLTDFLFYLLFL